MKILLAREIADAQAAAIGEAAPGSELVVLEPDGRFSGDPDAAEVCFFSIGIAREPATAAAIPRLLSGEALRWMQGPGAGVDHPIFRSLIERGVRLTSAAGIHAEPIAQYIFSYVLHWERNVARHLAQAAARKWEIIVSGDLSSKTLGIVGHGGIGAASARVARAFGMRVLATRRSAIDDPNVDRAYTPERLHDLLGESDYVVLCVPLTRETRHMIGAAELAAMRSDAVLINVARGGVVDEPALIAALEAKRIRGATLDVVSEEPLPESSRLWGLENCVITPHDAGYSPLADTRLGALFVQNLARYARGESLVNEVQRDDAGG